MANVIIDDKHLTDIANSIRGKNGTTDSYKPGEMSAAIEAISTGIEPTGSMDIVSNGTYDVTEYASAVVNVPQDGAPPDEAFVISGECQYRFSQGGWDWFVEQYGDRITTNDISNANYMFRLCNLETIPFVINIVDCNRLASIFEGCNLLNISPKIRGTIQWNVNTDLNKLTMGTYNLRYIDDLFEPSMLDGYSTVIITSQHSCPELCTLQDMRSLRAIPEWFYKFKLNEESTAYPHSLYCIYYYCFDYTYALDEILNVPTWVCQATLTSNAFTKFVDYACRIKNLTFETSDGVPIEVQWKSQTINLTNYVGYAQLANTITMYNSGITEDKRVTDAASYEALKNDPDWYTTNVNYSRYNKTSAINTINSLPDTSAYLAAAGGTNTIKFKGTSGALTDGGAINTMTADELAVATAKGWTVTMT